MIGLSVLSVVLVDFMAKKQAFVIGDILQWGECLICAPYMAGCIALVTHLPDTRSFGFSVGGAKLVSTCVYDNTLAKPDLLPRPIKSFLDRIRVMS